MKLKVNGESLELNGIVTVRDLLHSLKLQPGRVAVEVNLEVIPKDRYETTALHEGDEVEIVSFVGGG
ncbi:MAG: sulfur carrier protein ThiS [Deltaproteobacteria bacterium]|nr:sulfur carrier protein ThiS [Deltaproteobacteria bacterium]